MSRTHVHVVPILEDNYGYIIEDTRDKSCLVLDPGEAAPLVAYIQKHGLKPVAIWNTHHHADHIAGNSGILAEFPNLPVIGPEGNRGQIPEVTQWVKAGDPLEFAGETVQIFAVPGHTLGHLAFYFPSGHLFSGDLLFGYSCGKVFEGTLEQMYQSVAQFSHLPDETLVYAGHEYTFSNRKFAQTVDPDNADIKARIEREAEPPTIPLKLGLERKTNPFLRLNSPAVQAFTGKTAPAEVFAELRTRKDNFR